MSKSNQTDLFEALSRTKKLTQKERIVARAQEVGYIDNFYAIHHYILRLSERIRELEKDGYIFDRRFGEKGKKKDFHYYLVRTP